MKLTENQGVSIILLNKSYRKKRRKLETENERKTFW